MIEFHNAGKSYGAHWAVRGLEFQVARGEIFALLGPNGAGKTTTIKMLTGLLEPSEGQVLVAGHDITRDAIAAKAATGYVPDKSYLYEKLTGREFMSFVAALYEVPPQKAAYNTALYLDLLGIVDVGDDLIQSYSHGMRQRLLFASALVHEPRALVVDEPFVGLDPYGVRALTALIRELAAKGMAVMLATHSLHIAQDLCHRVGIIHKGSMSALIEQRDFNLKQGGLEELFVRHTS